MPESLLLFVITAVLSVCSPYCSRGRLLLAPNIPTLCCGTTSTRVLIVWHKMPQELLTLESNGPVPHHLNVLTTVCRGLESLSLAIERQEQQLSLNREHFTWCRGVATAINQDQDECLHLDVGGHYFHVAASVAKRQGPHFLSVVASHEFTSERDGDGYLFIDRDSQWFSAILAYLRDGTLLVPRDHAQRKPVLREARFYGVEKMSKILNTRTLFAVRTDDGFCTYDIYSRLWESHAMPDGISGVECCGVDGLFVISDGVCAEPFDLTINPKAIHRVDLHTGRWAHVADLPRDPEDQQPKQAAHLLRLGDHLMVELYGGGQQVLDLLWGTWRYTELNLTNLTYDPCLVSGQCFGLWFERDIHGNEVYYGKSVSVEGLFQSPAEPWCRLPEMPNPHLDVLDAVVAVDGSVVVLGSAVIDPEHGTVFAQVYDPVARVWHSSPPLFRRIYGFISATSDAFGNLLVMQRHPTLDTWYLTVISRDWRLATSDWRADVTGVCPPEAECWGDPEDGFFVNY